MSFFKNFKEDLSQAVNELLPDDSEGENGLDEEEENNKMIAEKETGTEATEQYAQALKRLSQASKDLSLSEEAASELAIEPSVNLKEEKHIRNTIMENETKKDDILLEMPKEFQEALSGLGKLDLDLDLEEAAEKSKDESKERTITEEKSAAFDSVEEEKALLKQKYTAEMERLKKKEMVEKVESEKKQEEKNSAGTPDEITTISKGICLEGNLKAQGSVELLGDVLGDVTCTGKLIVSGKIFGNPSGAEVYVNTARVEGNIISEGNVKIGNGSVVIGNIKATSAVIAGAVKGDIDVEGPVVMDVTAVVAGSIKSRSLQLNNGAILEGYVSQSYAGVDIEGLFASKDK